MSLLSEASSFALGGAISEERLQRPIRSSTTTRYLRSAI